MIVVSKAFERSKNNAETHSPLSTAFFSIFQTWLLANVGFREIFWNLSSILIVFFQVGIDLFVNDYVKELWHVRQKTNWSIVPNLCLLFCYFLPLLSLDKNLFTRNDLVLAAKGSKVCLQNHFWQVFSFSTYFTLGQTLTSTGRPFWPNWLIWNLPALQGWPIP